MIKDSGSRREFDTGAVRDIQDSKGRPSLMPLRVVSRLLCERIAGGDYVLSQIASFTESGKADPLYIALLKFAQVAYDGQIETMLLEAAIHFEEGAKKYGDNNWQKGIPVNCYLDSAIRHYLKYRRGDKDEPHDRAFVWNIMCCIWEVDYHHD